MIKKRLAPVSLSYHVQLGNEDKEELLIGRLLLLLGSLLVTSKMSCAQSIEGVVRVTLTLRASETNLREEAKDLEF
jgi:hypothetical protein